MVKQIIKISEVFESLQGEGKYVGYPALFIRLSGCNRACDFCDTKYHTNGKDMNINEIKDKINNSKLERVIWTGGEPMLQKEEIQEIMNYTQLYKHQLETNGDIYPLSPYSFEYIAISPKSKKALDKTLEFYNKINFPKDRYDIKVVTDLESLNLNMLYDATMLMPLSTGIKERDLQIEKEVWNYCVEYNIKYTPRIHRDVWGEKIGV